MASRVFDVADMLKMADRNVSEDHSLKRQQNNNGIKYYQLIC